MENDITHHSEINHDAIKLFHALSHITRLSICMALMKKPQTVSELCEILDLKQYMVSQQLSVLRSAGVVRNERKSRHVIYSLASPQISNIIHIACRTNLNLASDSQDQRSGKELSSFARIL